MVYLEGDFLDCSLFFNNRGADVKTGLTFCPFAVFVHNSNARRLLRSCRLLFGDLIPVESNNRNVVEDFTFHITPEIFFI